MIATPKKRATPAKTRLFRLADLHIANHPLPALFFIVVLGLLLRLLFFSGVGTSDDNLYSQFAHKAAIGEEISFGGTHERDSALTLSTRLGIIYITSLSYRIFGVNDFSSTIFILLAGLGNIILAYLFGKLLRSKRAGLYAAFILAIFPLEVLHSTRLLTDIPSAFFMALGIYLFLHAEMKTKGWYWYLLSGAMIGIGYLIRESALLIALFYMAYILYKRKITPNYFLVPLGFFALFSIELLTLYHFTGDPLFRYTTVQDYLLEQFKLYDYLGRLDFPQGLFHYPYIIVTDTSISAFFLLSLIALSYFLLRKKKDSYPLLLWFLPLLLYISFGSASFTSYLPFKADARYLLIISIPTALLIAFLLEEDHHHINRLRPALLALLLAYSLLICPSHVNTDATDNLREISLSLKGITQPIYTDERSIAVLNYVLGYDSTLNLLPYPKDSLAVHDSYLLINRPMIDALRASSKTNLFPSEVDNPSSQWIFVQQVGSDRESATLYRVP